MMLGFLMAIGAAASLSASPTPDNARVNPVAQLIRTGLSNALVDYPDTRFRSVHLESHEDDVHVRWIGVCGEMNPKNRMGGYNGWERFYWAVATKDGVGTILSEGKTDGDMVFINQICTPENTNPVDIADGISYQP